MKISKALLIILFSTIATAQHLTISSSGETVAPGTNWSITGNVLNVVAAVNASAHINTSVIVNHLQNTGDLTINLPWQSNNMRKTLINNIIAYTGTTGRTLTINSPNNIEFANTTGITSSTARLNVVLRTGFGGSTTNSSLIKMDGITIDTNSGHFWAGGGVTSATWNGLTVGNSAAVTADDDNAGISIVGSTITTNGGNISVVAVSDNTTDSDGLNYGINVENSIVSSGAGTIYFNTDLYGRYTNGTGLRVFGTTLTPTSISSTSGTISIRGWGAAGDTGNSWRQATSISGSAQIKSVSGNITVVGDAAFTASVNDKEGLVIGNGAAICSQTGNITLRGFNTLETTGQYCNSIRFAAADSANSIRIGYDGTNAYSGNIIIEGNSIYQRDTRPGAGSIAVQTTGTLTIQPTGNAFTYMRAFDTGTLTFDNDWNFGTNLGGFVYGKTTNTAALTYSNSLATNGPVTFNCSDFTLGDGTNISTSTASDITINANGSFGTTGTTRRTISSANGSVIIHADKDANGSGVLDLDYLTLNPGTGATIIRGETVNFLPGSITGPFIHGTGAFTFQSSDPSFGSAISTSWFEIDQDNNGIGGLTIGKVGSTANITFANATSIAGSITAYGGSIAVNAAITAAGDILLNGDTGSFLIQNTKGVTIDAAITTSNNGNITILGRGGSGTTYSANHGIDIKNKVEAGGTGNINIVGYGGLSSNGTSSSCHGVNLDVSNAWVKSNGGNITINGFGGGASAGSYSMGFLMLTSSKVSAAGAGTISITGTGGVNNAVGLRGVIIVSSSSVYSAGGAITITGNGTRNQQWSDGVYIENAIIGSNTSGPITISGQSGTGSSGILMLTSNTIGGASHANNITLRGNNMSLSGTNSVLTTGQVTIEPSSDSFASAITFPITNLSIANTITGLTLGKPTNTSNLTFANATTIAGPITAYGANININSNLKTTNSGAMYLKGNTTIAAGNHIESNGDFTHDGNMTFKSTATGTAAFGTLGGTFTTVSGASTVERYIPAKRAYRFLSPSVTTSTSIRQNWQENGVNTAGLGTHITGLNGSANGFDSTTTNNPSLYTINHSTGAWEAITNTNSNRLLAGTAYRLMVRGDRTISLATNAPTATVTTLRATGVLKTGPHSPTLNQATAGFSFVGNPYQATVDIKAVLAASTNMNSDVVYYWDPTLNDRGTYVTRNLASNSNSVTSSFNQYMQPGQAVFVKKAATASAANMLFTESNKSVNNGAAGVFRTTTTTTTTEFGTLRTNLRASIDNQWTTIEGALAVFNPMYSWEVTQEDANKFSNLDEEVSFMQNNTSLAIACQPNPSATNELPIRLNTTRHANYQWQFELGNYSGPTPYLFDTQNNTYTQIDNNTIVPFAVNGQELTRFKIVFQSGTLSTPDFSNQIVLYPNPGASGASSFNIEGITDAQVSLFTLLGQNISIRTATNGKGMEVISKTSLSKGVYLVNITKEGKTSHVKWIVE